MEGSWLHWLKCCCWIPDEGHRHLMQLSLANPATRNNAMWMYHFLANENLIHYVSFSQVKELKGEENERGSLFPSSCVRTGSRSNKLYQGSYNRVRAMDKNIPKAWCFCSEIESFGDRHLTFFLSYWNRGSFRYFTDVQNLIWKLLGNKGCEWKCKYFRQLNLRVAREIAEWRYSVLQIHLNFSNVFYGIRMLPFLTE